MSAKNGQHAVAQTGVGDETTEFGSELRQALTMTGDGESVAALAHAGILAR